MRNPFLIAINSIDDEDPNKDDPIDLRASKLLQIEFNATSLENFWCSQQHSYQSLAKQAISRLHFRLLLLQKRNREIVWTFNMICV